MLGTLDADPLLVNVHGIRAAPDDRPVTKFERRGRDAGRAIVDLRLLRR